MISIGDEEPIPVHGDPAMAEPGPRRGAAARIETPELAPGLGVEGDDFHRGSRRVEHALDDDRVALHLRTLERIAAVVDPSDLEAGNVAAIDLDERRVAAVAGAAVQWPVGVVVETVRCRTAKNDETENQALWRRHGAILSDARGDSHQPPAAAALTG